MESKDGAARPRSRGRLIVAALLIVPALFGAVMVSRYESLVAAGPGMEPTLRDGERFFVVRGRVPEAGDVIVFRPRGEDFDVVKRVVAVAGDRVEIRDDVVHRNGVLLAGEWTTCPPGASDYDADDVQCRSEAIGERRWQTMMSTLSVPESLAEQTVPDGMVFVLGDHRDRSNDSRNPRIGFVPLDRIHGVALVDR